MILSFGHQITRDLFDDKKRGSSLRKLPPEIKERARRKLLYLHDASELQDLKVPPGNQLEALRGDLRGFYSIRINDQWRLVFKWEDGNAYEVQILDYHK